MDRWVSLLISRTEILDTVLRTYDYLLSVLPRVDSFADALRESRCLRLAIADAYGAFTTLSIRAIKTFGRGNRLLTLRRFLWVRDRQLFYNSIENIERLVQMARQEAGWLLVDRRQTDDSKALQEIVQNTENILSTLSIENDNLPHKSSMKPVKHCTIPSRNPSFIGRDERIEEMHRHLHQRVGNQSPRQRSVALCGLGGIGKTQLAIEYARRFEDLYQSCFWVTCDSETKVFECFAQIARALELGEADVGQNLVNVKDWLSRTENWLLIFDNAGPPSDMDQFWPQSTNGSILVTTQDTSWLSQEYLTQSFQLDPLIHREGADLVKHIFERKNRAISDFEASSIHVETGGLPLAIRQISWYIIAENIDITEFLRNYRAHKSSKVVDAWGISTTPWYSHTLATFLDVAFEKLTSRAISILGIISLFDVDGIEGDLLRHDSQQSDGEFAILGDAPEYVSPAPLTFTSLPKYIC
ncbi:P-loop containing nucleoside triphosphate hydrolase protein [Hypoxylon rubiginosum]|uniref:P-loop containing nucleoside triphosphate hydrolase protein n=1 Tax=Hypoxylon rubiginosum TaxID=110542 RepID=A0ACB9ZED2_9PEZI|nr:P-loop containing nucleoside triphosphate hydrolase protein [Hypoxylon rubiginosum]